MQTYRIRDPVTLYDFLNENLLEHVFDFALTFRRQPTVLIPGLSYDVAEVGAALGAIISRQVLVDSI